jgi:hypothetical protein
MGPQRHGSEGRPAGQVPLVVAHATRRPFVLLRAETQLIQKGQIVWDSQSVNNSDRT